MCRNCNSSNGTVNHKAFQAALNVLKKAGKLTEVKGQLYIPIDTDIIRDAANEFLEKQGFVTTLQIKNHLRNNQYFVKQSDVSDELTDMADEGEIQFTQVNSYGKQHRLFFANGTPEPIAVAAFATTVH